LADEDSESLQPEEDQQTDLFSMQPEEVGHDNEAELAILNEEESANISDRFALPEFQSEIANLSFIESAFVIEGQGQPILGQPVDEVSDSKTDLGLGESATGESVTETVIQSFGADTPLKQDVATDDEIEQELAKIRDEEIQSREPEV
jgi:hypothetical protein